MQEIVAGFEIISTFELRTGKLLYLKKRNVMSGNSQRKLKRPSVRSLKIQPKTRFNKYSQKDVPEIKLCGAWLEQLGFQWGERVMVTSMPNLLIIRPE